MHREKSLKSDKELSKIPATYKPRKTVQKANYIPRRSELSYVGLVLFCAINLAEQKLITFTWPFAAGGHLTTTMFFRVYCLVQIMCYYSDTRANFRYERENERIIFFLAVT